MSSTLIQNSLFFFFEHRGRVVNTTASYSGGPGVQISSLGPAILTEVFRGFSSPSTECRDST
jgi:hypothetical protein